MGKISTIFFWLGGVITQTISEAAILGLYGQPLENINMKTRLCLQDLVQDLCSGQINGYVFCHKAIESSGITIAAEELEARIENTVTVRPSVLETIKDLPDTYQLWLISDYPPEWLKLIADRLDLYSCFQKNHLIITSDCHLTRMVPDIFYYMVRQANQPMDACLMVDGMSARAVHAIKHGLSSTIFVDAMRLKREFILRRMLPPPPGFTYPGPSNV